MTVAELIEKLKKHPPHLPVNIFEWSDDGGEHVQVESVETMSIYSEDDSVFLSSYGTDGAKL